MRETLRAQHYELVPWWTASEEMTYRRFFDITDLAGVRVEDETVFRSTHSLIRDRLNPFLLLLEPRRRATGSAYVLRERRVDAVTEACDEVPLRGGQQG